MRLVAYILSTILVVGCATTKKSSKPLPSTQGVEATAAEIQSAVTSAIDFNKSANKLIDEAIKLNLKAQKSIK